MDYTVLLPVYCKDKNEYLKASIDSILQQTLPPSQLLILVDGPIGSDLKETLEHYSNDFNIVDVKYFENNRGLGKVLCDGVVLSKYELIARMDSDDIALPNRFEKQTKVFQSDERLVLLGSYIQEYTYDLKQKLKKREVPVFYNEIQKYSKFRNPFNHMTVMFKKSAVLQVGNYEEMPLFEDYYLWVKLINDGFKVMNLPEVLVNVRAGNEMISKRSGMNYLKKEIHFQKALIKIRYINNVQFIKNIITRGLPRLIPNKLLGVLYNGFLRK